MVRVFGPDTSFAKASLYAEEIPFEVDAATLGEALDAYARYYDVSFAPYDGSWPLPPFDPADPKYFFCRSKRPKWGEALVDIHVERDDFSVCLRQDLAFRLLGDDIITIGAIAC